MFTHVSHNKHTIDTIWRYVTFCVPLDINFNKCEYIVEVMKFLTHLSGYYIEDGRRAHRGQTFSLRELVELVEASVIFILLTQDSGAAQRTPCAPPPPRALPVNAARPPAELITGYNLQKHNQMDMLVWFSHSRNVCIGALWKNKRIFIFL